MTNYPVMDELKKQAISVAKVNAASVEPWQRVVDDRQQRAVRAI